MSENNSPHLPSKDKEEQDSFNNLLKILFVIFISGLSSAAVALSVISWLSPSLFYNQTQVSIEGRGGGAEKLEMGTLMRQQLEQRTTQVFDTRKKIEGKYYQNNSKVSDAVLLSSDGWIVMHYSNYQSGEYRFWEVVDNKGVVYDIDEVRRDARNNLIYLHLSGNNFRVGSIDNWEEVSENDKVWVLGNDKWKASQLLEKRRFSDQEVVDIADLNHYFTLEGDLKQGSLVINRDGALLGFVGAENRLIPSWQVSRQLDAILSGNDLHNKVSSYTGMFVTREFTSGEIVEDVSGFYVTGSPTGASTTTIARGDLILEINGEKLEPETMTKQFFMASNPTNVKVKREGEAQNIILNN